ncbi:MAG: acyltransferase [Clostridia bacterium]|nr:acyltransferase [Clostridia bacterium]
MEQINLLFRPYTQAPDPDRIDVLDGVRALCVFLVGWYHIWQQGWLTPTFLLGNHVVSLDFLLRSGYIWVDGMLLLSGFLLYLPYANAKKNPKILPFYQRRLIRILPSYLLCILPLFILACARGEYASAGDAAKDLAAHLTFTHTLFPFNYQGTPLNGALWTLGVEMQFYLLFPFLARAFKKWPLITYALMAGAAFAFRAWAGQQADTSMYFNQLPAFLDVYANGFVAAAAYQSLRKKLGDGVWEKKIKLVFTVMFLLCLFQLVAIAQGQAASNGYDAIRQGQMDRRFGLSVTLCVALISAACSLPTLRFLLGNKLMHFLSTISFQFYIYHQLLAVKLKEWHLPPSALPDPFMNDPAWRLPYTLLCFATALIVATVVTYVFERPVARLFKRKLGGK